MRRRAFLQSVGASALALSTIGVGTAATDAAPYEPMGTTTIEGAAEAVVGRDGETAYVAAGDGFATVDVSDPTAPTVLAEVRNVAQDRQMGPLTSILDVKVDGDRLLVSGPAQSGPLKGLIVYDVSDPANPTPATDFYEVDYSIHNAFLKGDYAYLTRNQPGRPTLQIVDVSGQQPEPVGSWTPMEYEADVEGWSEMRFFPGVLHDMYVHDQIAYCAYWDGGTWLVDVSDPANPSYVNRVGDYSLEALVELTNDSQRLNRLYGEAPGNDHYVTVNEDASVMAIGGEAWDNKQTEGGGPAGIDLWDVSDVQDPKKLSTIEPESAPDTSRAGTWTTAHNFDIQGDRLYTAWYQAGVKLHDISDPATPKLLAWWREPEQAMFWTAQAAKPGEFFVGSAYDHGDLSGGLYTFPDRAGEQPDPPQLGGSESTPTETRTATPTETRTETRTATPTETRTETRTATPTETRTQTPTETATSEDTTVGSGGETTTDGSDSQGMPGFGVTAAVAGLGLGAYRLLGGREE